MAKKSKSSFSASSVIEKLDDVKERISDLEGSFEEQVEEHPVYAVGIAFGAGLVAGALIGVLVKRK